ncbi:MAG: hypothetical protein V4864_10325 [Pseudomonadota bacterium]
MPTLSPTRSTHFFRAAAAALLLAASAPAALADSTDTRHLAPGFTSRPAGSKLLVMPADMELFSISAGGVTEPRADWTEAAQKNVKTALAARRAQLGAQVIELSDAQLDEFAEIAALHRAVADAIWVHHTQRGLELPTKAGKLDWSLGEPARVLKERTGADYALFTWMRDTYASGERKAAIVALALLGGFNTGGEQNGYASLVDLNTGRIVWFNDLRRMWGDLREPAPAAETVEALLKGFPAMKP